MIVKKDMTLFGLHNHVHINLCSAVSGNWNWRDVDQLNHLIATA